MSGADYANSSLEGLINMFRKLTDNDVIQLAGVKMGFFEA